MELTSIGPQRNKGTETHFKHGDYVGKAKVDRSEPLSLRMWIQGNRRYKLAVLPVEVLQLLLALPPDAVCDAVAMMDEDVDVAARLPEVLKQLAAGALARVASASQE